MAHFVLGLAWRAGSAGRGLADEPRLNQVQVIGSHNSYHIAPYKTVLELIAATGRRRAESLDYTHPPLGRAILASRHPPGRARRVRRSQGRAVRRARPPEKS